MRTRSLAGLSLSCILVSAGVDAQEPIQQTVVVTAAATPVTLGSAIRTVAVLTREQIRLLPVRSVADAFRLVSSVDVRSRGERGLQTDFTVRGAGFGEALVLVDGVRLNDPQSGHHNGDIPVPLESIERIEVLLGPGSSLFGADAFGGTINIITRRDVIPASGSIEAGSFGYVGGRGQAGAAGGAIRSSFAASAERSDGFTFARDFVRAVVRSDTSIGQETHVSAAFLSNDLGANGFYGASPSHDWTSQALFAADSRVGTVAGWRLDGIASYRTHGDRFLWDVRVPGVLENRHRTHAVLGSLKASRRRGATATFVAGLEGGADFGSARPISGTTTCSASAHSASGVRHLGRAPRSRRVSAPIDTPSSVLRGALPSVWAGGRRRHSGFAGRRAGHFGSRPLQNATIPTPRTSREPIWSRRRPGPATPGPTCSSERGSSGPRSSAATITTSSTGCARRRRTGGGRTTSARWPQWVWS
jgi:iron complex outermembrane receptor protein